MHTTTQTVFLNEERVIPIDTNDDEWYLDTGVRNHMTGCKAALIS